MIFKTYRIKAFPVVKKCSILFLVIFLFSLNLSAQTPEKQWFGLENKSLSEAFQSIESIYGVQFSYNPNFINTKKKISLPEKEWTLSEVLAQLKKVYPLEFVKAGSNRIRVQPVTTAESQKTYIVSGVVRDEKNIPLMGANVYIPELDIGGVSDEEGTFSLAVPEGNYILKISYIFADIEKPIEVHRDIHQFYSMKSSNQSLEEVVVVSHKNATPIRKPQMSVNSLSVEEIKQVPVVLGEADPIKILLKLPGLMKRYGFPFLGLFPVFPIILNFNRL